RPEPGLPGRVTFPTLPGPAGGGAGGPEPHVAEQKNLQGPGQGSGGRGTTMKHARNPAFQAG
ncbi:MAG: hypothetical protein LBT40_14500, partial [Deltaproteobacteria bacterium]|nr:hypothetical protein [Deltaproteobacteria bacterium]